MSDGQFLKGLKFQHISIVPKSFMCNQNFPCSQDTCKFDHEFLRDVENDDGEIKMLAKKKFQCNNS